MTARFRIFRWRIYLTGNHTTVMIASDVRAFQQILGVGDTSLVLPDWPVLGVTVETCDVQTSKRLQAHYNVFHDHAGGLSESWFASSMQMHEIADSSPKRHCDSAHLAKSSKCDSKHSQQALWW